MSREHTRRIFEWLNLVASHPDVPPYAFEGGYVVAQHVNEAKGEAWPSLDTIASAMGMSVGTASNAVRLLEAVGLLDITSGKRGSKHPNRYRLIMNSEAAGRDGAQPSKLSNSRKAHSTELSPDPKIDPKAQRAQCSAQPPENKAQPIERNDQPAEENYLDNHSMNNFDNNRDERSSSPPTVSNASEDQVFGRFIEIYPEGQIGDQSDARAALKLALNAGREPDMLISELVEYVSRTTDWYSLAVWIRITTSAWRERALYEQYLSQINGVG